MKLVSSLIYSFNVTRLLSQPSHNIVQITTRINMSQCLQLYQWFMLFILSTSALTQSVLAQPRSDSFSFIHLYSCPVCEAQHDYDFTTAIQLALDNLEKSNGSTILPVGGRSHSNIKEPDTVQPAIQAIPLQVSLKILLDELVY